MYCDLVFVCALGISSPAAAQCPTLPDQIAALPAERRNQLEIYKNSDMLLVPFEKVLAAADLVVEGAIRSLRTYLSKDGCTLLTDYSVAVSHAHRGSLPPKTHPGPGPMVTVTTEGGEATIDGVRVKVTYEQLRPFTPGQQVILMLTRGPGRDKYEIAASPYGAFAVEKSGVVRHLLQSAGAGRLDNMERAAFLARVKGLEIVKRP